MKILFVCFFLFLFSSHYRHPRHRTAARSTFSISEPVSPSNLSDPRPAVRSGHVSEAKTQYHRPLSHSRSNPSLSSLVSFEPLPKGASEDDNSWVRGETHLLSSDLKTMLYFGDRTRSLGERESGGNLMQPKVICAPRDGIEDNTKPKLLTRRKGSMGRRRRPRIVTVTNVVGCSSDEEATLKEMGDSNQGEGDILAARTQDFIVSMEGNEHRRAREPAKLGVWGVFNPQCPPILNITNQPTANIDIPYGGLQLGQNSRARTPNTLAESPWWRLEQKEVCIFENIDLERAAFVNFRVSAPVGSNAPL